MGRRTVSSYVYMKVLEASPRRYDRGIRMLSRGSIDRVYSYLAQQVASPGGRVLDIGCGTGGVSLACARAGAEVVGIDINAGMLEVAREKAATERTTGGVEFVQLGAMEIEDRFAEQSLDAAVSCLAFSELLPAERAHVLRTVLTRLKATGQVVIADETAPDGAAARLAWKLVRLPRATLTWILTRTDTRPVKGLAETMREAGYGEVKEERIQGSDLIAFSGRREGSDE